MAVEVPPNLARSLKQLQAQIEDITFASKCTVVFDDGPHHSGDVTGIMEGIAVSNTFMKTIESPLICTNEW